MKTTLKFFTFAAVLFGFASISFAQTTGNATINVGATIAQALKITNVEDLHFGTIAVTSSGSTTSTITAASDGSRTGTAVYIGENYTIGEFLIEGEKGQTVNLSVDASAKLTKGSDEMNIVFARSIAGNSFELDSSSGKTTMYVGGTLTIADDQASGEYTGTYKVTVNYN